MISKFCFDLIEDTSVLICLNEGYGDQVMKSEVVEVSE